MSVRVLIAIVEEPSTNSKYTAPAQALLTLLEAVRLITCMSRFQHCYEAAERQNMMHELCLLADLQQQALATMGGMREREAVCKSLLSGEANELLRSIVQPLEWIVRAALPQAAPSAVGNLGTRFDYEHFFEARAKLFLQQTARGVRMRRLSLTYPPVFSPGGLCRRVRQSEAPLEGPDISEALRRIAAAVPLSHFIVNFGAADGECGTGDDWNADPANCLTTAGLAAVLIEGNPSFYPRLRRLFGGRANVSLVTQFVPLENVTALLHWQLATLPVASTSPDLLKMDLDHADCIYLEEALRIVHPKLVHLEYAPLVPPPLDYAQHYQPGLLDVSLGQRPQPQLLGGAGGPGLELAGCSLTAFLTRAPGYALVAASDEEALLVRRDLQPALGVGPPPSVEEVWVRSALCHPLHNYIPGTFAWGFDFRALADRSFTDAERMALLAGLLEENQASRFSLKLAWPPP